MKRAGGDPLDDQPSKRPTPSDLSPATSDLGSSSHQQSAASNMACSHLSQAFTVLNAPRPSQQVHRDECTLCFDDQDGPHGIDVCLLCFNGGCTGNDDRAHSRLHYQKTGHTLVVNVKRTRKPQAAKSAEEDPPKKLAIAAETDEDKYDWHTTPKCLACDPEHGGKELPRTDKASRDDQAIMPHPFC